MGGPVERSMGSSQLGDGDLVHPQATYMRPKLFLLLACLTMSGAEHKRGEVKLEKEHSQAMERHAALQTLSILSASQGKPLGV
jgi:hypothetical protein